MTQPPDDPSSDPDHPTLAGSGAPIEGLAVPGDEIGPYLLRECIGRGGMGEVWRAEQTQPVRRTVALKLIKAGMDSRDVLARFEAERQALALMDHPCIAKVFDAGTTPQGRPYFAMEYIQGIPIHDYCDRRKLDMRARLVLFQQVCQGVQHAHQKAVLHRDLKPTNILVGDVDGKPAPKIIDFGVAKATTQKLTEMTMFTSTGQLIGTPEYMSPEQADLTGEDVDTRTDVYSLGVILYELLVGALPFKPKELRQAGFEGIRKMIREQDPPRPSTRLTAVTEETQLIAASRSTELKRLLHLLRGDLDWIVLRTLEKDRNRRYGSPQELAQDIQRHLDDEPVLAGPPTVRYRASKFVRRHRLGVTVAVASVLALASFATVASLQARTIARERDRAQAAAARADAMNEFLVTTLSSADPWFGGDREATIVQALDGADEEIEENFRDQPELEASMRGALGRTYLGLGKIEKAGTQLERALALRRELGLENDPQTAQLLLVDARQAQLAAEYEHAVASGTAAARIFERDPAANLDNLLQAYQEQSRNLYYLQRYAECESVLSIYSELAESPQGRELVSSAEHFAIRGDLVGVRDGNPAAADSLMRLAYERVLATEPRSPTLGTYLNNSATYLSQAGKLEEALQAYDEALAVYGELLGTDSPDYATALENRGGVLYQLGRPDETLASLEQVLDIRKRNLGADHIDVVRTSLNVGTVALIQGQYDKALRTYEELAPALIAARGTEHPDVLSLRRNEAKALLGLGRTQEALELFQETLATSQRMFGEDHVTTARLQADCGLVLSDMGRDQEALPLLQASYDVQLRQFGAEHPGTQQLANWFIGYYERIGQPEMAESYRVGG